MLRPMISHAKTIYRKIKKDTSLNNNPDNHGSLLRKAAEAVHYFRHTSPNYFQPQVEISERANSWLQELREYGVVKFSTPEIAAAASVLEEKYFNRIDSMGSDQRDLNGDDLGQKGIFAKNINYEPYSTNTGTEIFYQISLFDNELKDLFRNPEISGVIYNYLRRQPYYRGQPTLSQINYGPEQDKNKNRPGCLYHVDYLRQITFMVLAADVTEEDSHFEYLKGSHHRPKWSKVFIDNNEAAKIAEANQENIFRGVGKKGSVVLFDSSGIHRRNGKIGQKRRTVFGVTTSGHHLEKYEDKRVHLPNLENDPQHVRSMFRFIE